MRADGALGAQADLLAFPSLGAGPSRYLSENCWWKEDAQAGGSVKSRGKRLLCVSPHSDTNAWYFHQLSAYDQPAFITKGPEAAPSEAGWVSWGGVLD